jgi:hypothetical protein
LHIDPEILRITFFAVVIALVFATRMTRGKARETPEGLVFSTKPIVLWTRLLFLPVYLFALFYPVITHRHNTPVWLPVVLLALLLFALYQSPGTILLTPAAVVQRFWFRADKVIEYSEVMTIQITQANRLTRVFGNNRITITHTASHSDAEGFRAELERRTGKRALV